MCTAQMLINIKVCGLIAIDKIPMLNHWSGVNEILFFSKCIT